MSSRHRYRGHCGRRSSSIGRPLDQLAGLAYELLDAHDDTAQLAEGLAFDERWQVHLDYLRDLQRLGREALARVETPEGPYGRAVARGGDRPVRSRPSTAVLFPGQGSHTRDMRALVNQVRPDLGALAIDVVGDDPFARAYEETRFAQPAIFCASLAGWRLLGGDGPVEALAGHSLGELAALVAAGSLSEEDGLRLAAARGRLMQQAGDIEPGGMLAVLGPDRQTVHEVGRRLGLTLANENATAQVVLSGPSARLDAAAAELGRRGLRVRRLPVGGAFHSPAMARAVPAFRTLLAEVEIRAPEVPVLSCVTAEPFDDVRARLAQAITEPVRWLQVVRALHARGVRRFVEAGPGQVLTGLVRRSLAGVEAEALVLPGALGA
jgi:[acyl-carrier-protein] S-malonyltransferase